MITRKKLALPLTVLGAGLAPVLLFAPVHASTTSAGCTVNPIRPIYSGLDTPAGVSRVDYKIKVRCNGGRSVEIQQFRMEEDQMPRDNDWIDEVTGNDVHPQDFSSGAQTRMLTVRAPLPKTAGDGPVEEVYHKVRFRVTTAAGTTAWTPFELSAVRAISR